MPPNRQSRKPLPPKRLGPQPQDRQRKSAGKTGAFDRIVD
jgi:hypothetical protein